MVALPSVPLSLEEFPESGRTAAGMRTMTADPHRWHGVVWLNVVYAVKSGLPLHLHIIWPPMDDWLSDQRYPAVLFAQGSGWQEQSLGQWLLPLGKFAQRGYVVAIVECRPSALALFPGAVRDLNSAVRFLTDNAERYKADPDRLAAWGDSSGAHTAVLSYLTEGRQDFSDEPVAPLGLRAVVDYYGPSDLTRMQDEPTTVDHLAADSPEGRLLGGVDLRQHPGAAAEASALAHIPRDRPLPPLLIMHGGKDRIVPFGQSVDLYEALRAAGQPVELVKLTGADHGDAGFWTPAALDLVDDFLRQAFETAASDTD
ncbi:MAG: alpha/beta hydrolase [Propionibacteriaceae bacterium]|jgi:acetyl esterase/lipase|nr:alpha/beta hydrolase [Propionibacteriaceae bacterium]